MGSKEQAEALFLRIDFGKENMVKRPKDDRVDRILRRMIEKWNWVHGNKPIINVGEGYYKPRNWIAVEIMEYRKYRRQDSSREESLHMKGMVMDNNFYNSEEKTPYEQLSLSL